MTENAAKVEAFLLLAKQAKGLAIVDLITRCTSEPGLVTFGEILSLPAVQEVRLKH
jgi:COP9 signalosome complex subunit 7